MRPSTSTFANRQIGSIFSSYIHMDNDRTTHEMPKTNRDEVPMPEERVPGEPAGQGQLMPDQHSTDANPMNPPSERT